MRACGPPARGSTAGIARVLAPGAVWLALLGAAAAWGRGAPGQEAAAGPWAGDGGGKVGSPAIRGTVEDGARRGEGAGGLQAEAGQRAVSEPGFFETIRLEAQDLWRRFAEDPTLEGRVHFTYRAQYTGKFYDFRSYRFPFPWAVSEEDRAFAEELEERHGDVSDHDVDQYVSLRWDRLLENPAGGLWSAVHFETAFRYYHDLDGSPAGEEARNSFDAFAGHRLFQLLTLNAAVEMFDRHLELRLGRQFARGAEWAHFDGARAVVRGATLFGLPVETEIYGGLRARIWRRTGTRHQGLAGGAFRIRLRDDLLFQVEDLYFIDNSLRAELRKELGSLGYAALIYRQINEDPERARLETSLDFPGLGLGLFAAYTGKFGRTADDFDFDYTRSRRRDGGPIPYLRLGDPAPYDEVFLEVRKGFLYHYGVFAGLQYHRVRDRDLRDEFDRDWVEVWGGLDTNHAPWKGFTGRVAVRYVDTDLRRRLLRLDPVFAVGNGAPDFQPEDITGDGEPASLSIELLAEQDFFRYVAAGATLVLRVYESRTNYAELKNLTAASAGAYVRWRPTARMSWTLSYAYDRDFEFIYPDLEALHTVRLTFTYRF